MKVLKNILILFLLFIITLDNIKSMQKITRVCNVSQFLKALKNEEYFEFDSSIQYINMEGLIIGIKSLDILVKAIMKNNSITEIKLPKILERSKDREIKKTIRNIKKHVENNWKNMYESIYYSLTEHINIPRTIL